MDSPPPARYGTGGSNEPSPRLTRISSWPVTWFVSRRSSRPPGARGRPRRHRTRRDRPRCRIAAQTRPGHFPGRPRACRLWRCGRPGHRGRSHRGRPRCPARVVRPSGASRRSGTGPHEREQGHLVVGRVAVTISPGGLHGGDRPRRVDGVDGDGRVEGAGQVGSSPTEQDVAGPVDNGHVGGPVAVEVGHDRRVPGAQGEGVGADELPPALAQFHRHRIRGRGHDREVVEPVAVEGARNDRPRRGCRPDRARWPGLERPPIPVQEHGDLIGPGVGDGQVGGPVASEVAGGDGHRDREGGLVEEDYPGSFEAPMTVALEDRHVVRLHLIGVEAGDGEAEGSIPGEVARHDGQWGVVVLLRGRPQRVGYRGAERPFAATPEHGDAVVQLVRDGQVGLAVAVEVARREPGKTGSPPRA